MMLEIEDRPSPSPDIDRVWRSHSSGVERMLSVAVSTWELVTWTEEAEVRMAVRGPETVASMADVPDGSSAMGISFSHGTRLAHLAMSRLVDTHLASPRVTDTSFALRGESWPIPRYDDAEDLVDRLVGAGALLRDPLVGQVLAGSRPTLGARSVQRRIVAATGLTQRTIQQIERARQAAVLLGGRAAPLDVVHRLGYYDQPHLARSLKRFIGRSATELRRPDTDEPMSLLYKTET